MSTATIATPPPEGWTPTMEGLFGTEEEDAAQLAYWERQDKIAAAQAEIEADRPMESAISVALSALGLPAGDPAEGTAAGTADAGELSPGPGTGVFDTPELRAELVAKRLGEDTGEPAYWTLLEGATELAEKGAAIWDAARGLFGYGVDELPTAEELRSVPAQYEALDTPEKRAELIGQREREARQAKIEITQAEAKIDALELPAQMATAAGEEVVERVTEAADALADLGDSLPSPRTAVTLAALGFAALLAWRVFK